MNNSDQPAYPTLDPNSPYYGEGLTKSEYFSGLAMQAMVARGNNMQVWSDDDSKQCLYIADSLLNQLEPPDSWDQ